MLKFIARRLLSALPLLLIVPLFVFLMLHLTPGEPESAVAVELPADVQATQAATERSLPRKFAAWFGHLLIGDLGQSSQAKVAGTTVPTNASGSAVSALVKARLAPTLWLLLLSLSWALPAGLALGAAAAWRAGGGLDRAVSGLSALLWCVPVFVLACALIWATSQPLGGDAARGLVLPALALGAAVSARMARLTRAAVMRTLSENHVRSARAKGLPGWRVLFHHALASAAAPIALGAGRDITLLVAGVVLVESAFGIAGLGKLVVDAALTRDFPTLQSVIVVWSLAGSLLHGLVTLGGAWFDPRARR